MSRVYIDGPEEENYDRLGLEYVFLGPRWNGFEAPRCTEAQFRAFVEEWKRNDPNGVWGEVTVNDAGNLVHHRSDVHEDDSGEDDEFGPVGRTDDNQVIYAIEGWVFYQKENG